ARIARNAGAPLFPGAGVDLLKKTGDAVKKGEPLYRIYSEMKSDYELASEMACECLGYTIGK
ncbi:MAG TPA: thymidine phosphorylase, partial [Sphingomonadales bacterium]|nr:thymidine phosphorylase [Sphingomonadales bacterium]